MVLLIPVIIIVYLHLYYASSFSHSNTGIYSGMWYYHLGQMVKKSLKSSMGHNKVSILV